MRESRLSGSEGGVAPMGHPYPYGRRDARRYEREVYGEPRIARRRDSRLAFPPRCPAIDLPPPFLAVPAPALAPFLELFSGRTS